jgi:anti-sigma factor RsiW
MSHVVEELTALLDGALAPDEERSVRSHLAGCASCQVEEARLRGATALLGALPLPPPPSPAFAAALEARLAAERGRGAGMLERLLGRRWRLAIPAAAAAAATLVAVGSIRQDRARERDVAARLDLLEEYAVVASLGDVETAEDAEVVAHLDELAAAEVSP